MAQRKEIKVIFDTNIFISFLIGRTLIGLKDYITSERIKIIISAELLAELAEVLSHPKIQKQINPDQQFEIIYLLDFYADKVTPTSVVTLCRDKKDNFLLALSKDSEADYLVTGDQDLLVLKQIENTGIVSPKSFEEIINEKTF